MNLGTDIGKKSCDVLQSSHKALPVGQYMKVGVQVPRGQNMAKQSRYKLVKEEVKTTLAIYRIRTCASFSKESFSH